MIKVNRGRAPGRLIANATKWTSEFLDAVERRRTMTDAIRHRYRHPEIKAALTAALSGKCVYCESKVSHVYPGDVEHIAPKSLFPQLYVEWDNLTFACSVCNRNKADYYDPALLIVNPHVDDPTSFFLAIGEWIFAYTDQLRAGRTIDRLALNRPALLERRKEHLQRLVPLITLLRAASSSDARAAIMDELREWAKDDKEYAFVTRIFLQAYGITYMPAPEP